MEGWESDLTAFLRSFFSQEDSIRVLEAIKDLGVCSANDLKYVEAKDLTGVLRPVEIKKVLISIKRAASSVMAQDDSSTPGCSQLEDSSTGDDSFFSDDENLTVFSMPVSCATRSPASGTPMRTCASPTLPEGESSPFAKENCSWHYSYDIPWDKIPSNTKKLLDMEKRPSAAQRREIIRIVSAEILTMCRKPGKKHIIEIARKMVIWYPKSFRDEIDGQVVGTGYDSLVKQFISRMDNCRRLQASTKKRLSANSSPNTAKKACRDGYGCINPEPELPSGETTKMQREKQEELMKMFQNNNKDAKKMEQLMLETFPSQRRDILSGQKETGEMLQEWPFLSLETGTRLHFRELTGVQIDDNFVAFTVDVDDTAIGTDVATAKLPSTPCIVVCGNNPLTARVFMVAVDQHIVNDQLPCFTAAFHMMFCAYYIHNIDYPVELAATLEFLQRCVFKINPDQGSKVKRKDKGRQYALNPRVLSLLSKIANFEWME